MFTLRKSESMEILKIGSDIDTLNKCFQLYFNIFGDDKR